MINSQAFLATATVAEVSNVLAHNSHLLPEVGSGSVVLWGTALLVLALRALMPD